MTSSGPHNIWKTLFQKLIETLSSKKSAAIKFYEMFVAIIYIIVKSLKDWSDIILEIFDQTSPQVDITHSHLL